MFAYAFSIFLGVLAALFVVKESAELAYKQNVSWEQAALQLFLLIIFFLVAYYIFVELNIIGYIEKAIFAG